MCNFKVANYIASLVTFAHKDRWMDGPLPLFSFQFNPFTDGPKVSYFEELYTQGL